MPSANKDRIRVTLHVDRGIYSLLQKMSKVEQKPMSRIIDEAIKPLVERYQFPTPESWERFDIERKVSEGILDFDMEHIDSVIETPSDEELRELSRLLNEAKGHDERKSIIDAISERIKTLKEKDEYRQRWVKYCSE